MKTICFTGHRQIDSRTRRQLSAELLRELERQIREGASVFRAGGALGFDTLAAQAVLKLRRKHPEIRLELILPCPSQADAWATADKRLYENILANADTVRYTSTQYYAGVLQLRNRQLVEASDTCIAYLTNSHGGGTAFTCALALRKGLKFVNLADRVRDAEV